jgi:hypothetical protein
MQQTLDIVSFCSEWTCKQYQGKKKTHVNLTRCSIVYMR